jgi:hypothetical protein
MEQITPEFSCIRHDKYSYCLEYSVGGDSGTDQARAVAILRLERGLRTCFLLFFVGGGQCWGSNPEFQAC